MSKRISRKELLKGDEIADVAGDAGRWLEEHWRTVLGALAAVAVVAAVVGGFMTLASQKRAANEALLSVAMRDFTAAESNNFFDADELSSALYSADAVIEKAPDSEPGRIALYYKAVTLKHLGRVPEAITAMETLAASGWSKGTAAGAAELFHANLYAENGRAPEAVTILSGVVANPASGIPTQVALLRLGEIHKQQGDRDSARAAWQRVVDEFPNTASVTEARRHLDG